RRPPRPPRPPRRQPPRRTTATRRTVRADLRRPALATRQPRRPQRPRKPLPNHDAPRNQGATATRWRERGSLLMGGQLPTPRRTRRDQYLGLHVQNEPRLGQTVDRTRRLDTQPTRTLAVRNPRPNRGSRTRAAA